MKCTQIYLLYFFYLMAPGAIFAADGQTDLSVAFKVKVKELAAANELSSKDICEQAMQFLGEKYSPEIAQDILHEAVDADISYVSLSYFDKERAKNPAANSYNDVSLIKILFEGKAIEDVNKNYDDGMGNPITALHLATQFDLREMIQLLIDHNANPDKKYQEKTCVDLARSQFARDILEKKVRYEDVSSLKSWLYLVKDCSIQ